MATFLRFSPVRALALLAAAGAVLTGCTTLQPTASAPAPAAAPGASRLGADRCRRPRRRCVRPASAGSASGRRCAPGGLRPFADVIKDAKRSDGILDRLAEGRQGLARAQARGLQPPVLPLAEAEDRHRRARLLRRLDAGQRHRRVPPRPQPGAADLAQRRLHRQAGNARGARDRGRLLAEPAGERAGAEPARARAQVGAGRGQHALPRRSARLRHGPAAHLSPGLRLRSAQLGDHPGAAERRCARPRRARPLRDGVDLGAAAGNAARRAAAVGAEVAARPAQHVPDHQLFARAAAGRADARAPRRSARRLLRERPLRLQQRPAAHAAPALRQPLAPREEGSRCGALRAGQADRLLDRPHRAVQVPRGRSRPASSSGTRRSRRSASRTRCGSRSSPRTPTSTRSTSAARRSAG